jgi:glutamine amidotransferase
MLGGNQDCDPMITVVDYQMGNLASIVNMLKRAGFEAQLSSRREDILAADKLVLPGVGAFDTGMTNLADLGLIEPLEQKVLGDRTPVLGICLGMQLLLQGSAEGERPGLGWIRGRCVRFDFGAAGGPQRLKVPHMGWNEVRPCRRDSLFATMTDDAGYYFVHSYHARCEDPEDVLGTTTHGYEFVSALQRGNIAGTQFHPEKSHRHGMRLLAEFARN